MIVGDVEDGGEQEGVCEEGEVIKSIGLVWTGEPDMIRSTCERSEHGISSRVASLGLDVGSKNLGKIDFPWEK